MAYKKIFLSFIPIVFLGVYSSTIFTAETLKVGEVTAKPGEMKSGFIRVPSGQDGPDISIPVTVIRGEKPGPVLALTAGIHGYEYPPIIALQRLRGELAPEQISGTVILVHCVNVSSFFKRTVYYNPYDGKNMNRAFPGKIDGTMTERIAFQISREVIDQCDYLIDNHCGDGNEDLMSYLYCTETGDTEVDAKTRALAINYGFKVIIHETARQDDVSATWCANSALLKGKPALTIESGKLGRVDEEDIVLIVKGSYNALKHLGMLAGKPARMFDPVWVKSVTYIRSEHEGLYYALGHSGRHVEKGEVLGYLTDFFGNIIQKAVAPHDGIIMYIIATPPLSKGEPMVKIGRF